jgi:hypothetical protein
VDESGRGVLEVVLQIDVGGAHVDGYGRSVADAHRTGLGRHDLKAEWRDLLPERVAQRLHRIILTSDESAAGHAGPAGRGPVGQPLRPILNAAGPVTHH